MSIETFHVLHSIYIWKFWNKKCLIVCLKNKLLFFCLSRFSRKIFQQVWGYDQLESIPKANNNNRKNYYSHRNIQGLRKNGQAKLETQQTGKKCRFFKILVFPTFSKHFEKTVIDVRPNSTLFSHPTTIKNNFANRSTNYWETSELTHKNYIRRIEYLFLVVGKTYILFLTSSNVYLFLVKTIVN